MTSRLHVLELERRHRREARAETGRRAVRSTILLSRCSVGVSVSRAGRSAAARAAAAVVAVDEREQQLAVDGDERVARPRLHGVEIEARRHRQRREPIAVRRELHFLQRDLERAGESARRACARNPITQRSLSRSSTGMRPRTMRRERRGRRAAACPAARRRSILVEQRVDFGAGDVGARRALPAAVGFGWLMRPATGSRGS